MTVIAFALAAGLGGAVRHGVNRLGWEWRGTLLVNTVGSFALGWLVAAGPSTSMVTVVGTGFLGALTTFSMLAIETVEAPRARRWWIVAANVCLGIGAAFVGFAIGS